MIVLWTLQAEELGYPQEEMVLKSEGNSALRLQPKNLEDCLLPARESLLVHAWLDGVLSSSGGQAREDGRKGLRAGSGAGCGVLDYGAGILLKCLWSY